MGWKPYRLYTCSSVQWTTISKGWVAMEPRTCCCLHLSMPSLSAKYRSRSILMPVHTDYLQMLTLSVLPMAYSAIPLDISAGTSKSYNS